MSTAFPFITSVMPTASSIHGAETNTLFVAAEIAIVDVVTGPGDQHLAARKWQMTRFGLLFGAAFDDNFVLEKERTPFFLSCKRYRVQNIVVVHPVNYPKRQPIYCKSYFK